MQDDEFLTVSQAATRLQTSDEMVRRMLREGRLGGFRLGGRKSGWRIPGAALRALAEGPRPTLGRPPRHDPRAASVARALAEAEACRREGDDVGAARWEQIAAGIAAGAADRVS